MKAIEVYLLCDIVISKLPPLVQKNCCQSPVSLPRCYSTFVILVNYACICLLPFFYLTVFHNLFDDDVSHIETCIVLKNVVFIYESSYLISSYPDYRSFILIVYIKETQSGQRS